MKLLVPHVKLLALIALLSAGCMAGCVAGPPPTPATAAVPPRPAAPSAPATPAAPVAPPRAAVPAADASLAAPWNAVLDEVGAAACSSSAECRSMPVGAKACGGPERYLAWSIRSSDEARLRERVAAYNAARQADNEKNGRISNCMMLMDPGASCEAGRCVTPVKGGSPLVR